MISSRSWFLLLSVLSLLVAVASWRFLALGWQLGYPDFTAHLQDRRTAFILHVVLAPVSLAAGLLQFLPRLRARRPGLHRWTGRLYVVSVALSGSASLWLGIFAIGGSVAGWGFGLLALCWLVSTALALRHAVQRRFLHHQRWMLRSYALTLASVTLRFYLLLFLLAGSTYANASPWLVWLCWLPNLLLVEIWLARRAQQRGAESRPQP